MVGWLVPVVLKVAIGSGLMPYFNKRIAGLPSRPRRYVVTYAFCAVIALIIAFVTGQWTLSVPILGIGFINAIGTYFWWRAMDISLSKSSLYGLWGDALAMCLSYLVLGEGRFLTTGIIIGLTVSAMSAVLFAYVDYRRAEEGQRRASSSFRFYAYIGICFTIYGVASFLMRLWKTQLIPLETFTLSWYLGCVPGTLFVFGITSIGGYDGRQSAQRYSAGELLSVFLVAATYVANISLAYWAYQTSQLIVQPIFMVGSVVLASFTGLYIFKEHKKFTRGQWYIFALGFIGCCIIAISR